MKRAPIIITSTVAGLAGLLTFHTSSNGTTSAFGAGARLGATAATSGATSPTSSSTSSTPGTTTTTKAPTTTTLKPTPTTAANGNASSTTTRTVKPTTTTAAPTTTTAPASGAMRNGTATGEQVNYNFGVLDVQVTVSGGKITSVTVPSIDDGGNPRSQQIDQYAIPILEQEVMQAQSANVQSVSGASYTSAGFLQSLQNAISKL